LPALPKIAVYLSSHGYGHTIRTAAILERVFTRRPVSLTVVGSAPNWLWPETLRTAITTRIDTPTDVGVVQTDEVTVDRAATKTLIEQWQRGYAVKVEEETRRLRDGFDLVVADVPPLAFDAAYAVGVPSVAIATFSWDWIYEEMGLSGAASDARHAYERAGCLIDVAPSAPMTAFANRVELGLVGRRAPDRADARRLLGTRDDESLVLVAFRAAGDSLLQLPEPSKGIKYAMQGRPAGRDDVVEISGSTTFMNALAACDLVVAKPGYGILGDVGLNGLRILYTDRKGFPEDPVLVNWLRSRTGSARIRLEELAGGCWLKPMRELLEQPVPVAETDEASQAAAACILDRLS
jgi:hypothetical protein